MDTLIPFISCLVTEDELQEYLDSPFYSEIYVEQPNRQGFTKYVKLTNKRLIKIPVSETNLPKELIKVLQDREEPVTPEINFLPAGKVPSYLFDRIVKFFRKVMEVRNAEVEAHAWIVWNPEQGYHIVVPRQNISKASVSFEYDEVNKPGNIIVVDIHSHNTMSAFYSGTDNASDEESINYSMVVGNLKPESYTYVIRFNVFKVKVTATYEDVFDEAKEEGFEVPQDWLDKIVVPAVIQRSFPSSHGKIRSFGGGNNTPRSFHSKSKNKSYYRGYDKNEFWNNMWNQSSPNVDEDTGEILEPAESDILKSMYGQECGEAVDQISAYLEDLTENSEALLDVIRQAYAMLDDKGRYQLATNGF